MQPDLTIRLVDISYVMYRRWHATRTAVVMGKVAEHDFNNAFVGGFKADIERLHRYEQGPVPTLRQLYATTVFVFDCMRDKNWRKAVCPAYKTIERTERDYAMFDLTYNRVVPEMVNEFGIAQLRHPNAEADDIVGVVKKHLAAAFPEMRFEIFTNDKDFLQLHCPRTRIVNIENESIYNREMDRIAKRARRDVERIESSKLLTMKILGGDPSDNIGPVGRLTFGEMETLADDVDKLDDYRAAPGNNFDLNRQLMDMSCIPDDIQAGIMRAWAELIRDRHWTAVRVTVPARRVRTTLSFAAACAAKRTAV